MVLNVIKMVTSDYEVTHKTCLCVGPSSPTTEQMSTVGLNREAGCLQADGTEQVSACGSTGRCWFLKKWRKKKKNMLLSYEWRKNSVYSCVTCTAKMNEMKCFKRKRKNAFYNQLISD